MTSIKYRINFGENIADELVWEHSFDRDIFLSTIPFYRINTWINMFQEDLKKGDYNQILDNLDVINFE